MYKRSDLEKPYFLGVAMAMILLGAFFFALGLIEWLANIGWDSGFSLPTLKVMGGAIIIGLGYIHLELEMFRVHLGAKK